MHLYKECDVLHSKHDGYASWMLLSVMGSCAIIHLTILHVFANHDGTYKHPKRFCIAIIARCRLNSLPVRWTWCMGDGQNKDWDHSSDYLFIGWAIGKPWTVLVYLLSGDNKDTRGPTYSPVHRPQTCTCMQDARLLQVPSSLTYSSYVVHMCVPLVWYSVAWGSCSDIFCSKLQQS